MKIVTKQFIPVIFFLLGLIVQASASAGNLPDFTELVEKYSAAVVNISTKHTAKLGKGSPHDFLDKRGDKNEMLDELMRRFFDRDGSGIPADRDTSSLGSGFIVSKDGYIVTNHHVISGADEIIVKLSDRRELVAKVIGSDKRSDVALLKVEADDLPVLKTGSSDKLKVGEWVVAIGSPFGFDHSVTAGIVSAKGRSLPTENYVPFIQTDVAINPGNSGGPLFNLKGEVVGINSQIYSRSGGFMGVSFAIPVDIAKGVIAQLKSKGKVSRGWLGVYIQEVTRELALSFGLDRPQGALIVDVMKDGPANGVLQQGDIVLEFNGKAVDNASALPVLVGSTSIDKEVDVKVRRGDETKILRLKLAELPAEVKIKPPVKKKKVPKKIDQLLGMELADLDDKAKEALDVEGGVLVKRVRGNPARKAGVERGDIVSMFNGIKIRNANHFHAITRDLTVGKTYAMLVLRDGSARFLAIKIDDKDQLKDAETKK